MGIKKKQDIVYTSDTGQTFNVARMTPSHLLNVIAHHLKQADALEAVMTEVGTDIGFLPQRLESLKYTINILTAELSSRDPEMDNGGNEEDED